MSDDRTRTWTLPDGIRLRGNRASLQVAFPKEPERWMVNANGPQQVAEFAATIAVLASSPA